MSCRWCNRNCGGRHESVIKEKQREMSKMFEGSNPEQCWKLKSGLQLKERYRFAKTRYYPNQYIALLNGLVDLTVAKTRIRKTCGSRDCYNPWHFEQACCQICKLTRCKLHDDKELIAYWKQLMLRVVVDDGCWIHCDYYDEQPVTLRNKRWSPEKLAYRIYYGREVPLGYWRRCSHGDCINPCHYTNGEE